MASPQPADPAGLTPSLPLLSDPQALGMAAHPEGGWFRETWRHQQIVPTPRGPRALATSVSFLLLPGQRSDWHRVASDELWLWQGGGPLRLSLGGRGDHPELAEEFRLGPGSQQLVPARVWQSAEPAAAEAVIVGCIVSPGFTFADFSLAPERPAAQG